jgi:hypothetical protein
VSSNLYFEVPLSLLIIFLLHFLPHTRVRQVGRREAELAELRTIVRSSKNGELCMCVWMYACLKCSSATNGVRAFHLYKNRPQRWVSTGCLTRRTVL